jgi:multidrug efflux pump subunit AcrA (membrane-fusion protein)
VNRRSNAGRSLERLVRAVARTGDPLWHPNEDETLPPQLQKRLEAYRDCTHVRSVAVIPLGNVAHGNVEQGAKRRRDVGVLVFERFDGEAWTDAQRRRIEAVCRHATPALQNAAELSGLPLLWLSRITEYLLWPFGLRRLPITALLIAAIVAAVAALCLVPGDFVIAGRGELQPALRRHVFAPADAVIETIHVEHSGPVAAGDVLLELRHSDLDFKMASLLGDLQTQQTRLETVRARRLNFARLNSEGAGEFDDLTSEEERLKTTIASLAEQKEILSRQLAELTITSQIDGEVLTWGIDETLKARAVRRGERLLTVADTAGPWQLEMWISDHDVEHVLRARRESDELPASFVLASRAGTTVRGHVEHIGMATETTSEGRPGVRVVIAFDREEIDRLRPGTTAFVKIHCGQRPIGYVWFREVLEVARTRLLF